MPLQLLLPGTLGFLGERCDFLKSSQLGTFTDFGHREYAMFLFPGTDFCFRVNFLKSAFDPFSHHKTRLLILLIRKQKSQKSQESVACSSCPSFYSPTGAS